MARQVGDYRLEILLGAGGMGEVYRAYDTRRDRYVALKLLPEAVSGDPEYVKRFQRESHVAARLRDPHVIPIHDSGEIDGQLFIDMRLVDGADIGALLVREGRVAPERAVRLISQAAEALDSAHADHLVHRDIKPSNILVTSSDFVYVVDFGIARPIGGQQTPLTRTGETLGTWHYMAPERFTGHDVDGRADVYSLACVLYECLTGEPPFSGKELPALMYAHLNSDPPGASSLVEGVPPALDAVAARGMAKDPKNRFPTAGALAAAAREALVAKAPAPQMTELHHTWTETPEPTWQQAGVATAAWPAVAEPPGPGPASGEPATQDFPYLPTQAVAAVGVDARGYTRPPENVPQGTTPDPGGSSLPPGVVTGGPTRGRSWRRLGVPILAVVAAVAVAIVVVVMASPRPKTVHAALAQNACSAASLAPPTIAENIAVGANPNYVEVAPNGKFAYVTNQSARVIDVLNTATDQVSGHIPIPQGPPQAVSFSPDSQTAYVSVYGSHSVPLIAFIDTATGTVTSTVPVDNHEPGPSATSLNGLFLYVPNHNMVQGGSGDNVLDAIDLATKKVTDIAVEANPHWVVVGTNGLFYVTDHQSDVVTVLNASTNGVIKTIDVGETPHSAALSPDGTRLAVTSYNGSAVFLINTATDQMIKQIPVGREPLDIAYSPDGRYLFTANNLDNTVTVINTADYCVLKEIPTGSGPTSISVLPDGRQAYVTDENDGTIEVLNLPE